ncbi:MAG: DnaJ domain-containing protein [Chitinophagales bacterium]|nr:DnaJ domain-containing protein [Chitinophagales bacterium]
MANRFSFTNLIESVSKLISEEREKREKLTPLQQAHQSEIENSVIVLAAAVVRCNNNFTTETEKHFQDYLEQQFGAVRKRQRLKHITNHIEIGTEPFTKIACKELKLLTTYHSRVNIVHFLFGIAASDDFINPKELRCLQRISGYLDVTTDDFQLVRETFAAKHNPYILLGVEEGVSIEKVKSAYRKMILKYHPDKVKNKASEADAARKFREIQRAYEIISKQLSS